jgi:hypothetical protein
MILDKNITRGLTRQEAAAYVGLSTSGYRKKRSEGKYPGPTLPGNRYDKNLLDAAMDRLSGISESLSPLKEWRASRGPR